MVKYFQWALNFLFFYVGWGVCMHQASIGNRYLGPMLVLGMFTYHLSFTKNRLAEAFLILSLALIGSCTDLFYSWMGLIDYKTPFPFLPYFAPLWIISIWVLFTMSLNHSLVWLNRHWTIAVVFGIGGSIVSYYAGFKIGAARPLYDLRIVLASIGLIWAGLLPFCLFYAKWITIKLEGKKAYRKKRAPQKEERSDR